MKLNLGESAVLKQWGDRRTQVSKSFEKRGCERGRSRLLPATVNVGKRFSRLKNKRRRCDKCFHYGCGSRRLLKKNRSCGKIIWKSLKLLASRCWTRPCAINNGLPYWNGRSILLRMSCKTEKEGKEDVKNLPCHFRQHRHGWLIRNSWRI